MKQRDQHLPACMSLALEQLRYGLQTFTQTPEILVSPTTLEELAYIECDIDNTHMGSSYFNSSCELVRDYLDENNKDITSYPLQDNTTYMSLLELKDRWESKYIYMWEL